MEQLEFFRKVIGILNPSGLHYMVVGSFASGFWGEPRSTFDMDVVIAIAASDIPLMSKLFPHEEYYFSPEAAREAIRLQSQFNVIHPESGNKIDFMVRRDDDWSHEQFKRRRVFNVPPGFDTFVAAPEDVILGKLQFYREGGSEKHLRDITGIVKMQGNNLDLNYLKIWSARLGVSQEWDIVRQKT